MNVKRALILSVLAAMMLPGLVLAQTTTRATIEVTKNFLDGNDEAEVTVSIDCNTGQILDQEKDLADGETVTFVVTSFNSGQLNCSIEESGTDGYSADYNGNGIDGSCEWEDITDGTEGVCTIDNSPDEVDIDVTKVWNIVGDNNDVNLNFRLRAYCDEVFVEKVECEVGNGDDCAYTVEDIAGKKWVKIGKDSGEGPGTEEFTFSVRPAFPSSSCWVNEKVDDSAIEIDNDCSGLTVSAGQGASCTITNTVFFEGIPTLSQYGMAIMALLMLGVGFVGFRRFV
jgi:IPTL-CTERM motif